MPSWVSEETTKIKIQRDEAKKRFQLTKSPQARVRWRNLNTRLNDSYEADKTAVLNKQLEDLRLADERGHYTTTWNIIHSLSGRNIKTNVKVKLRKGDPPENEEHLLEEWKNYFSSLLTMTVASLHQRYLFRQVMIFPSALTLPHERKRLKQLLL